MNKLLLLSILFPVCTLQAQVVINEIDYDQPSTDNAEFIEIKNNGSTPFDLSTMAVLMYNGSSGTGVLYRNISDPNWPMLNPGDYFVICGNISLTLNCDHAASPMTNLIQNGPTDAIALISLPDSVVLDVVSYGGTLVGHVEGTGSTEIDSNSEGLLSLNRWPDGNDTNDNEADFTIGCPTPGEANDVELTNCGVMVGVRSLPSGTEYQLRPSVGGGTIEVVFARPIKGPVGISVIGTNGALIADHVAASIFTSWSFDTSDLHGKLVLVRVTTAEGVVTQRTVVP